MSAQANRSRRSAALPLTALLVASLAGCAGDSPAEIAQAWTAPAWMAEHTAAREDFLSSLHSCVASKGWDVDVSDGGGFGPFGSDEEVDRFNVDFESCQIELGFGDGSEQDVSDEQLRQYYRWNLDIRECIMAHSDLELAPPPSEDAWVDTWRSPGNADLWIPWGDPAFEVPGPELDMLLRECPQPFTRGS